MPRPIAFLPQCGLCLLSAGLIWLAFPKTDLAPLAYIALIPFLIVIYSSPRFVFGWGYFFGLLYFGGLLHWLVHVDQVVAFAGLPLLVMYLALYPALFAMYVKFLQSRPAWVQVILVPAYWCVLEYIRSFLLSGFSFATLGLSQYKMPLIIQIADITGMYGVSFLIVCVNVLGVQIVEAARGSSIHKKDVAAAMACTAIFIVGTCLYGYVKLNEPQIKESLRVGIVQGNIPQEMKWKDGAKPVIIRRHFDLTRKLIEKKPELIVWPETAFPSFYGNDPLNEMTLLEFVQAQKRPLLFGTVRMVAPSKSDDTEKYFNSAVLLSSRGTETQHYDKHALVPFGEYLPFRGTFPALSEIVPIADFTRGKEYTVFQWERDAPFSTFICFEDTLPDLTRRFVLNGARFLVNLTNDAWFGDTKAPYMHFQSSVFRAVENRRSVVRATNTGLSGFISPQGKIQKILQEEGGQKATFTDGVAVSEVPLNSRMSLYTRYGDFFAFFCTFAILLGLKPRKKN